MGSSLEGVLKNCCLKVQPKTQRCVTKTLLPLLLTMAPACAKLDLLEMTLPELSSLHCWTSSPPGCDGRYGTEGCLCWRRGPSQDANNVKTAANLNICPLTKPSSDMSMNITSSMFLPMGWRNSLCRCPSCIKLYADSNTSFLTEESDTVHHYESQAIDKKGTLEQGMEALSQLDRVKQVEAIHSYNNMKQNLMDYLSKFAESKKVVREDDIRTFFEGMKGNK